MYRVLIINEAPVNAKVLHDDFLQLGIEIVGGSDHADELAQVAVRACPDIVVVASNTPSENLFESTRILSTLAPCPVIVFTADGDVRKIDRACASGIHAYIVNGYGKHRLLSIIQVAKARFRHEQFLKEEYSGISKRLEERTTIDRAKSILIKSRSIAEEEAFNILRSLAMQSRQRIGVVAQGVIDMSRAGEAVNRAGQLRMLSQRIVKVYAQVVSGFAVTEALQILSDCVVRVEANLSIIQKAVSGQGYDGLVQRISSTWQDIVSLCSEDISPVRLKDLNALAEDMLKDSESLTQYLESSGLVATLNILNIAGRQRMLSQRIAKICFFLVIEPDGLYLKELSELQAQFAAAMDHLSGTPLSSVSIRDTLGVVRTRWSRLTEIIANLAMSGTLTEVSECSEALLDASELLAEQYERAMQVLVGDRLVRLF